MLLNKRSHCNEKPTPCNKGPAKPEKELMWDFLGGLGLGLCSRHKGWGVGSILSWGTNSPHDLWRSQEKKF